MCVYSRLRCQLRLALHDLPATVTFFIKKNTAKYDAGYRKGYELKFQGWGHWIHSIHEVTIHAKGIPAINNCESFLRHHCSSYTAERATNFPRNDLI